MPRRKPGDESKLLREEQLEFGVPESGLAGKTFQSPAAEFGEPPVQAVALDEEQGLTVGTGAGAIGQQETAGLGLSRDDEDHAFAIGYGEEHAVLQLGKPLRLLPPAGHPGLQSLRLVETRRRISPLELHQDRLGWTAAGQSPVPAGLNTYHARVERVLRE